MSAEPKKTRGRVRSLRCAAVMSVLVVYLIGVAFHTGFGSPSAFGVEGIAVICPLGALETAIAGRIVLPLPLIAFLVAAVLTAVVGRVFCGWVCPVPLTRKLITNREERDYYVVDGSKRGRRCTSSPSSRRSMTSLGLLFAVLVTTFVFGFPIFCLVCPVGLIFATLFALVRLVVYNELVVDLIVFPALILLELVVLRKWCSALCPIGALLGLFSRFNRHFIPTVNAQRCLVEAQGLACDACHRACNFDIDLVRDTGTGIVSDCSKCNECAEHCPTNAISFPWKNVR